MKPTAAAGLKVFIAAHLLSFAEPTDAVFIQYPRL
jgi:hypothetical protein